MEPHSATDLELRRTDQADRTAWFTEARIGVRFHWGLHAIPARGESAQHEERIPPEDFARLVERFAAPRFRAEAWATAARSAGARYVVLPAKPFDGFSLFHSVYSDFTVRQSPLARDVLLDLVDACREADLDIGLAYALIDWHHPDYPVDRMHPLRDHPAARARPRDLTRYLRQLHGQMRELMSNYGRIDLLQCETSYDEMSGDTWMADELIDLVCGLQPQLMLTDGLGEDAWVDVVCGEGCVAGLAIRQADVLLNRHRGYARDDDAWIDGEALWRRVVDDVAAGANTLIHVGANALGELPAPALRLLADLGARLARYDEAVYGAGNAGLGTPDWGRWTASGGTLYAHVWQAPAALVMPELRGRVRRARLLDDGSEIVLKETADGLIAALPSARQPCVIAFDLV